MRGSVVWECGVRWCTVGVEQGGNHLVGTPVTMYVIEGRGRGRELGSEAWFVMARVLAWRERHGAREQ